MFPRENTPRSQTWACRFPGRSRSHPRRSGRRARCCRWFWGGQEENIKQFFLGDRKQNRFNRSEHWLYLTMCWSPPIDLPPGCIWAALPAPPALAAPSSCPRCAWTQGRSHPGTRRVRRGWTESGLCVGKTWWLIDWTENGRMIWFYAVA